MAYFAPTITASGLSIPAYSDIVNQLVADAQSIFGSDIYLQPDSMDYQMISAFASMIYDSFLTAQAVYNSRGPATAIGSGLDAIVGINGITRMPAVYSTCPVVVNGASGTTIVNGVVGDVNGNYWSLPGTVVISSGGTITVTATCQVSGAISANPGDITTIVTPQLGWTSVANSVAATVGSSVESDSALRARQALSTAQPSLTVLEGLKGAIAAVAGVTRFEVYENDTSSTDANGNPANSVTAVVEGGAQSDIANAIFAKKGPGVATNGTTSVSVTDSYGQTSTIKYDVVQYTQIDVTVNVKKLSGYVVGTTDVAIKTSIVDYLNANPIGGTVYYGQLWATAMSAIASSSSPAFSITSLTCATHGNTQGTTDIPIAFNYASQGVLANITVNAS